MIRPRIEEDAQHGLSVLSKVGIKLSLSDYVKGKSSIIVEPGIKNLWPNFIIMPKEGQSLFVKYYVPFSRDNKQRAVYDLEMNLERVAIAVSGENVGGTPETMHFYDRNCLYQIYYRFNSNKLSRIVSPREWVELPFKEEAK